MSRHWLHTCQFSYRKVRGGQEFETISIWTTFGSFHLGCCYPGNQNWSKGPEKAAKKRRRGGGGPQEKRGAQSSPLTSPVCSDFSQYIWPQSCPFQHHHQGGSDEAEVILVVSTGQRGTVPCSGSLGTLHSWRLTSEYQPRNGC